MKVMIHACPKRMWYVDEFLIPQLKSQGIYDIILWNDEKHLGNLKSFIASAKYVKDNIKDLGTGIWHLQDDVLLSKEFRIVAESMPKDIVCNGMSDTVGYDKYCTGYQPTNKCWWSFPCIYIPNKILAEFYDWFIQKCLIEGKYSEYVTKNKYDDYFFKTFLRMKYRKAKCYNIIPNVVQHIDYLIGGRVANAGNPKKEKAAYWTENALEKELERKINEWRDKHDNA